MAVTTQRNEETTELAALRARLEAWRQTRGGPGRRIPDEFWGAAARIAQMEGVAETAETLQMDQVRLGGLVDGWGTHVEEAPPPASRPRSWSWSLERSSVPLRAW